MTNINIEHYKQRLKDISINRFKGRLAIEDVNNFCETLMGIAEELNDYQSPPDDIVELARFHIMISKMKPIDICSVDTSQLVQDLNKQLIARKEYLIESIIERCIQEGMKAPPVNNNVSLCMLESIHDEIYRAYR